MDIASRFSLKFGLHRSQHTQVYFAQQQGPLQCEFLTRDYFDVSGMHTVRIFRVYRFRFSINVLNPFYEMWLHDPCFMYQ